MPTKTPAWAAKDGTLYATAELACRRDLFCILGDALPNASNEDVGNIITALINQSELVVESLTTGPTSRPGARKHPGTSSPARINLQLTLDHLRKQYDLTDAEIIQRVQDKSILKFKSIGEAKFASLQKWAQQKGLNQHKATETQAASGIKAMREAVEAAPQAAKEAA